MDSISSRVRSVFLEEGEELLSTLAGCLQELVHTPKDMEILVQFRRSVHNFKGAAVITGLSFIADLAMELERAAYALQRMDAVDEEKEIQKLLKVMAESVDLLSQTLIAVRKGEEEGIDLRRALRQLRSLVS